MKNKKFVKTATLLSSLMGLAILSSSFSSSVISTKQNDSIKSDNNVNNNVNNSISYNNVPTNDNLTASASDIFYGDKISGEIYYIVSGTESNEIWITGYSDDFHVEDPTFKSTYNRSTITTINYGAFYRCQGLFGTLSFPSTITLINSGDTMIEPPAFASCNNITKVDFTNSILTSISSYAFKNCESLQSVILPTTTQTISIQSFKGCTSLDSLNWSDLSSLNTINYSAFESCTNLKSVDLPSNSQLETIKEFAFCNCRSLSELTVPYSVTSIGRGAFQNSNLSSVYIPQILSSIGGYAFAGCPLTDISISEENPYFSIVENNNNKAKIMVSTSDNPEPEWNGTSSAVGSLVVGSLSYENLSIVSISSYQFESCWGLTSVDFGDTSINIDHLAFSNCKNLSAIYFGDNAPVTSNSDYPFSGCTSLKNVYIPKDKIFDSEYLSASTYQSLALDINTNYLVAETDLHNYVSNPENLSGTAKLRRTSFDDVSNNVVINSVGDISLINTSDSTLYLSTQEGNNITGIDSNAFTNSDASIESVKIGKQINKISENAFDNSNVKNIDLSDWTANEFKGLVDSTTISSSWLGNLNNNKTYIIVATNQIDNFKTIASDIGISECNISDTYPTPEPTPSPDPTNNNLALGLGLGLGLGIPVLAGAIGGTIYGVKKHKAKK